MKHTRSRQFLERLTRWLWVIESPFVQQPIYCFDREISIEEAKRMFNFDAHPDAIGVRVGHTVYAPMRIDPQIFTAEDIKRRYPD